MTEILNNIERKVNEIVPAAAQVSKVSVMASEVFIYTRNLRMMLESETLVKTLAGELKKRVHIRSDPSTLKEPSEAKAIIGELVPKEAGIEDISFDGELNEAVIEAAKPGLVIGKHGSTLKQIALETGWYPKILRVPTSPSPMLKGIRYNLLKDNKDRVKFLKDAAKKIYRDTDKHTEWVRLTPLGGAREVGRSCFVLETPESKVLLDCGINVSSRDKAYPLLGSINFAIDELDAVIVSHAHLDHSGFVPYLYQYGYRGPTYCTSPTRDLMALLQMDYIDVIKKEGIDPPYGHKDVKTAMMHTITKDYGEVTDIAPDIRLTLHNAGHILGSASAHLHIGQGAHNLLYTGDFKYGYTKLFDNVHTRYPRIETVITESTYGNNRDVMPPRYVSDKRLVQSIIETTKNGGSVVVPVFAVGRAQEILLVLEEYAKYNSWDIPIYIDGMTREVNAIHTAYPEFMRRNVKKRILHNNSPFDSDIFIEVDKTKRGDIADEKGSVFISPSGMMNGGPSVEYFKNLCESPLNKIIFVGYQGEGSLGKKIQTMGKRNQESKDIALSVDGRTKAVKVKMQVETIEGFSGHSDRAQLLSFYKKLQPKPERVITVHGDERSCISFAKAMGHDRRVEINTPRNLDSIRLK